MNKLKEKLAAMSPVDVADELKQVLEDMTEESYDPAVVDAYLAALEETSPMPKEPDAQEALARFRAKLPAVSAKPAVKQRTYTPGRIVARALKYVVMAAGIAVFLFTMAFAVSETVRVNTMNLIIRVFETDTEFQFQDAKTDGTLSLSVGWVPDGYTMTKRTNSLIETQYEFQGPEGTFLHVSCIDTAGTTIGVDTEDAKVEYVDIHEYQAMLVEEDGIFQLCWPAKDNTVFIHLTSEGMGRDDLLHVARELDY